VADGGVGGQVVEQAASQEVLFVEAADFGDCSELAGA
jgi:hypothetical protein